MLKELLKKHDMSMYRLSKLSGVAYSTINDIANGRVQISNCKAGLIRAISDALEISMDELYSECDRNLSVHSEDYDTDINVYVKNKTYYAEYEYQGETKQLRVCETKADYVPFAKELALWDVEDAIRDKEWEKVDEILADEKKRQDHDS